MNDLVTRLCPKIALEFDRLCFINLGPTGGYDCPGWALQLAIGFSRDEDDDLWMLANYDERIQTFLLPHHVLCDAKDDEPGILTPKGLSILDNRIVIGYPPDFNPFYLMPTPVPPIPR